MVLDVFRVSFQNFEVENTDALVSRYEEVFVEGDFDHFKVFTTESKQGVGRCGDVDVLPVTHKPTPSFHMLALTL